MSIDEAGEYDGVAERFYLRRRKLRDDFSLRTNSGNPLSDNRNRTILNRSG
jgi:hypothetical protein